jgi:hypothetical protein
MAEKKPLAKLTKAEAYREAQEYGLQAAHVANVIVCWHRKPFTRLIGLLALLRAGREVRTGQFSLDTLVIDGEQAEWSALERAADERA